MQAPRLLSYSSHFNAPSLPLRHTVKVIGSRRHATPAIKPLVVTTSVCKHHCPPSERKVCELGRWPVRIHSSRIQPSRPEPLTPLLRDHIAGPTLLVFVKYPSIRPLHLNSCLDDMPYVRCLRIILVPLCWLSVSSIRRHTTISLLKQLCES